MTRPLALQLPLHGSRLIEASAGTGKTWTLSALYVRLVLGHGGSDGFGRPLTPPEILVVTYTRAASGELRDRIRARLVEAAGVFRQQRTPDDFLAQLRDDFPEADWPRCAWQLDIAAQWMDEAAISTIHGWCQRMLREHAFASGSLLQQSVESTQQVLLTQAARDYWREHCYALEDGAVGWLAGQWKSPDVLLTATRELRAQIDADMSLPRQSLAELLGAAMREQSELKAPWPEWCDELEKLLDDAAANGLFPKGKLNVSSRDAFFRRVRSWACDGAALDLDIAATKLMTRQGLAEIWQKGPAPDHPALHALVGLEERVAAQHGHQRESVLRHAAAWISHRFDAEKRRQGEMDFQDMLTRLDAGLAGPGGVQLAEAIGSRFPLALIDEFQDTDPLQYRIFDRIYSLADSKPGRGLFLIGDPKQAIYGFRGADIHTYMRARQATHGRHHHLDTNYRSSAAMVTAVNQVFTQAEQRSHGQGAFAFRAGAGDPLPFLPVQADGLTAQWEIDGEASPALTWWHLASDEPLSGSEYNEAIAASTATEIVRLLKLGREQRAGFREDGVLHGVQASDIAILVRTGTEARVIRQALSRRGVRSVYLSNKDSIYASREAADMRHWLRACAQPDDVRLLRNALATGSIGLGLDVLEQLGSDEREIESRVMQFRAYHERWQRHGVLPMLRQLMHELEVPQRLQAGDDGERALTNLLHLAELLQQAAAQLDGEQALIRHFDQVCQQQEGMDEEGEQVLRLESDAALVRVITIHKAKGLEYPLVFLPFASSHRGVKDKEPVRLHDGNAYQVVFEPTPAQVDTAEAERLGEDLRLLYVALTRARHACWVGVADRKYQSKDQGFHQGALGYLLGDGLAVNSTADIRAWLDNVALADQSVVVEPPAPSGDWLSDDVATLTDAKARKPQRGAGEHWWIASYSALRIGDEVTGSAPLRFDDAAPASASAQVLGDEMPAAAPTPQMQAFAQGIGHGIHGFPRGPAAGTFLHGLLEYAGGEGFAWTAAHPDKLRDQVARRCQLRGWSEWTDTLTIWLTALLQRPLPLGDAGQVSLAQLSSYQPELEFWLASTQVDVQQLDGLVRRHTLPGVPRRGLLPDRLNGMFKGFIDLVFEHDGRWWVVDYKSNWLGPDLDDYTEAAMAAAVAHWRYDLQYVSYLLALHRQLRARLPDYDYDRHIGGAMYLFLRGQGSAGEGVYTARPPRELIETLDGMFRNATGAGQ